MMQGVPPGALLGWIAERRQGLANKHDRAWRTGSHRDRSGGIRAWAKDQGIAVSGRGRIPANIVEQYEVPGDVARRIATIAVIWLPRLPRVATETGLTAAGAPARFGWSGLATRVRNFISGPIFLSACSARSPLACRCMSFARQA
jgi:hypothetical protein